MSYLILNANSSRPVRSERRRILLENGFEVAEAVTTSEVLSVTAKLPVRLILVGLPIGPNVPGFWRRLRSYIQVQEIPLIVTCATNASACGLNRSLADVWLPEPVSPEALISVIRMLRPGRPHAVVSSGLIGRSAEPGKEPREAQESVRLAIGYRLPEPHRAMQVPASPASLRYETVHDLMSPLSTITAITSWIVSEYGVLLDETGREYLDLLQKSIERMHRALSAILDAPTPHV